MAKELQQLRAEFEAMRPNFDQGFTGVQRERIAAVSVRVLNKPVRKTSCRDCFRDAYIEIVKKLGELEELPALPDYILKAGVVYSVPCSNVAYVGDTIPVSVAENWLRINPQAIRFFQRYPDDWEARVNGQAAEAPKPKKSKKNKN